MRPEQVAALVTASTGIIIAVLAMVERSRTRARTLREAGATRALDSWESFTHELRAANAEQERQYDALLIRFGILQDSITDARVKIARHESTEIDQARRITELTEQVADLRRRLDGSTSA